MPIIKTIKGDLFDCEQYYLAHGVNCQGVMGAGVAKVVADKYPEVELAYREFCYRGKARVGIYQFTQTNDKKKAIVNMFTQENVGTDKRQVHYGGLARAFSSLNDDLFQFESQFAKENNSNVVIRPAVAIPRIGAGLAGGDWDLIQEIIDGTTPLLDIYLYELLD
jgi:O-acetyl-ADP-ribose deacetylase (regulator of RNase III)